MQVPTCATLSPGSGVPGVQEVQGVQLADVFISYASEDRETARTLAHALEALGWSVWWDRHIIAGQTFDDTIERELNAAKSVVALWSRHSIASEWVRNEAGVAADRSVLVPALIDRVAPPLQFRRRQTVDLVGWDGNPSHEGFKALCRGIAASARITAVPPAVTGTAQPAFYRRHGWLTGGIAALAIVLAGVAYRGWPAARPEPSNPPPATTTTTPAAAAERSFSAAIEARAARVRWTGTSVWLPDHGIEARNELRLPVSFRSAANEGTIVRGVRVLVDSAGTASTWEAMYETDDAALEPNAPVDPQIRGHRMPFRPFELTGPRAFVTKTIDFVPVDHPSALGSGTHALVLQVRHDAAAEWSTAAKTSFTVPAGFALAGRDSGGVQFSRYDYWQTFPLTP